MSDERKQYYPIAGLAKNFQQNSPCFPRVLPENCTIFPRVHGGGGGGGGDHHHFTNNSECYYPWDTVPTVMYKA